MNLIKVVYTNRKQVSKNGKNYPLQMYFIEYNEGKRIPIKPIDSYDYAKLDVLARVEFNDSVKKDK